MKENQTPIFEDYKSFGITLYHLNGAIRDSCPSEFEVNNREEFSNSKYLGDFSMDYGNGKNFLSKEKMNGLSHNRSRSLGESVDLSSFHTKTKEAEFCNEGQCNLSSFHTKTKEAEFCNEGECRDSGLPNISSSDSLETQTNLHTEENVLECELPELEVCYKEINDHSLKEICIDEGMPIQQRFLNESAIKEDDTSIDCKITIQEFGTVTLLGSSINNLDGEDDKIEQRPDQVSSRTAIIEDPAASSTEEGLREDMHCNNNEPSKNLKDGISDSHITRNSHSVCSKETVDKNCHNQSPDNTGENSDSPSHYNLQFDNSRGVNSTNSDAASELHVSKHENRYSGNDTAVIPGKNDVGESSFSSASLVPFSGPIPFSGSVSLRSDSSTATSGRSFAFPILQPEWNSSPVKMTKADDGHFRKHKNWRSGLLCCRF